MPNTKEKREKITLFQITHENYTNRNKISGALVNYLILTKKKNSKIQKWRWNDWKMKILRSLIRQNHKLKYF